MQTLSRKEQNILYHMKRGQRVEYRLKFRATLIWELTVEKKTVRQVAKDHQSTVKTVRKWRNRFEQYRIRDLYDRPRSGAPRKFDVRQRCEVIALACDRPQAYGFPTHTHWNLNILTKAARMHTSGPAMSRSSIHRTLQRNELKPHRHEMWLHSKDPLFREKVNDIVSLYLNPPPNAVVVCIDEKTGMQALERKAEPQPARPGRAGRYEYKYIRHGTLSLLAAFEITTGQVTAQCRPHRKAEDLVAFMNQVARTYPGKRIIVIWDNLNIHHEGSSKRWTTFNREHGNRFEFHYTPLHASWVNQVELFCSILRKRCLKWGDFPSVEALREKVMAFIQAWNDGEGHPFHWTFGGYPMQSKEAA